MSARVQLAFPLYSHPPRPPPTPTPAPTLCIAPPRHPDVPLSADVESLTWQAYLALRGITGTLLRWHISPEGAPDARLPLLLLPDRLLPARAIPDWADPNPDPLQGYRHNHAKDESHAWIALLEAVVHAALSLAHPPKSFFCSTAKKTRGLDAVLSPPPPPATGFASPIPPFGTHVDPAAVHARYAEAIAALSDRLATDTWFLGSENPTALDALVFAYLYTLLHSTDSLRIEVARRANLVAWERSVRSRVQAAFEVV